MGNPVFANSMEISSKSMPGKSICEFPDVCFTPPQTPATPPGVPIPYPNTGMAGDTTDGSRSVKIGGKEVMLKDSSSFKQSTGDEAGAAPKKGLVTSTTKGKVYFIAWSMDVKIEGENVVRNLDLTTHNHSSKIATGSLPTVHVAKVAAGKAGQQKDPCDDPKKKPKTVYIVYMAQDANGKVYIGRTRGPANQSINSILAKRKSNHHRKNIGPLYPLCETDSYAAVRGAEEKHYADFVKHGESVSNSPRKKDKQINPISPRPANKAKKAKYMGCAKSRNALCGVCGA